VLFEVNYPVLQPQSRLALFGLFGLSFLFLHLPAVTSQRPGRLLLLSDWAPTIATMLCFCYVIIQTEPAFKQLWIGGSTLGDRAGQEVLSDYVVGFIGLAIVLEAARRSVGMILPLLALVFLVYARFGTAVPDWLFPHRGYTWSRIVSQAFLHSQGVFGIALNVMFTYVFPFVLFGAFLKATGATDFIIRFSRRLFGNSPGGPAKVAVLSSGLMGSLSGSAVANTATTGTFTIPMMQSSGFKPHLAAGVEAAASSGGALMPPIMGAGAYMMLEIVTPPVTYVEIIKAALIPAILYYVAMLLAVHLHARKIGATTIESVTSKVEKLSVAQGLVFVLAILGLITFLLAGFTPFRAVTLSLGVIFVIAPWSRNTRMRRPDYMDVLSRATKAGIPLIAAASCVGIILGVVTLTGIGTELPSALLPLAKDNLFAALFLLMISTIILGLGLPSAVCYLLMATLVGPALTKLGVVPLSAHLFIFYFGMMSMVTPPVALAAYTAAAIAKANVMRSSFAAFGFALIGFVLPYAFVLKPSLLLISTDGGSVIGLAIAALILILGSIIFLAVSTAGYCFNRVNPIQRIILFIASFIVIFMPEVDISYLIIKVVAVLGGGSVLYLNARPLLERKKCIPIQT
jgi:TRAP transporter 4TM/12TM fusion protein